MANEDFKKAIRKVDSRMKAKIDSKLMELRSIYDLMSPGERNQLGEWIEGICDAQEKRPNLPVLARLKVNLSLGSGEGKIGVSLLPLTLREAIEHWDRGECYTPTTIKQLTG